MTSVCLKKSGVTSYSSFSAEGHSGYGDEGSDIVCAAVSAATELVIEMLRRFGVDSKVDIDEKRALVLCNIRECEENAEKRDIIENLLGGYIDYVRDVEKEYPKYLKCKIS